MANPMMMRPTCLPSAQFVGSARRHLACRNAGALISFKKRAQPCSSTKGSPNVSLSCRCKAGRNDENITASQTVSEESPAAMNEGCCTTDSGSPTSVSISTDGPTKTTNKLIALSSATAAVVLFLVTRGGLSGATLADLAASTVPYEEAISNGRPTVVEFYADWCEVCREMAPDVYKVEQQYKDVVNFVMLNVDNTKWEEELDEFGVEGIPHFAFLDRKGNEEGNIVGRLPKRYLEANVMALSRGEEKLPHSRVVGQFSNPGSRQVPRVADPRSHGV